ncbi:MAG TPA: FKBP-type peptidyl-prolyl cis-trans isomerase [Hyphomicrobiales bacterium]|nr:FKBP-type peptidyl-prolyl cis-trans isomerase [Hyphomicrobiales bacterium]
MLRYLLALSALLLLLVACGPAEVPEDEAPSQTVTAVATEEDESPVPAEEGDTPAAVDAGPPEDFAGADYETTDSGLQFAILEQGDGDAAAAGDIVRVDYRGLLGDGTMFDTSEGGEPIRFPLGQGAVIPGWDEGIALLNEGGRALLVIPPDLGYGEAGSGGVIPPNATLYFEVELVEVLEGGPDEPVDVAEEDYETAESGLQVYVIEEGDGEMPEDGQPVRVDYTAWIGDGTRLDSSIDTGEPLVFALGSEQIFAGMSEAVSTMRVGGQSQFIIPPELAFGEEGAGAIPPNSSLIFLVDLLEVLPPAPDAPADVAEDEYSADENGFLVHDVTEGDGDEAAAGDVVEFHVTGWLEEDGAKILSSYDQGEAIMLPINSGQALPGWDAALTGMKPGGVRQVIVSPELGFGETGAGTVVPPNATLIWLVELIDIVDVAD